MSDLISRHAVINAISEYARWNKTFEAYSEGIRKYLLSLPSADRPQGEWIEREQEYEMFGVIVTDIDYKCTNCENYSDIEYDFCPNCGARMKGADDE